MELAPNDVAFAVLIADVLTISVLALRGIAMAPLPLSIIAGELVAAIAFGLTLDVIKIPTFARLRLA